MRIFVEADSVVTKRMSGIGHVALEILNELDDLSQRDSSIQIIAIVPFGKKRITLKYGWKKIKIRQLPPGYKYVNYALVRTSLPLPVDLWYGRGIYVFPNYKNWYVPFSQSTTFVHDIAFKLYPETTQSDNLVYLNANFNRWMKRTGQIVTDSEQSQKEIEATFPDLRGKVKTVHLAVNTKDYMPRSQQEVKVARERYGIKEDYFLTVGNLEPRKNIKRLLGAYKEYADSSKNPAQLVVIGGDGWKNEDTLTYMDDLQQQGYDILRPSHYVQDKDLPAIYSGARALIHVAIHEGFGLPPVEAQACGVPIIVSNLPVFKETLSAVDVKYVDAYKVGEIATALKASKPVIYPRTAHVKEELTWNRTVQRLMSLLV